MLVLAGDTRNNLLRFMPIIVQSLTKVVLLILTCFIGHSLHAQTQIGQDILGEALGDFSGSSICMPDERTIAIGANYNDGNGNNSGHVRIYSWNGSSWVQKGMDIDGDALGDQSGYSVSMPDSNTIAIGAQYNNPNGQSNKGHVRIYSWNGSLWVQKGTDIDGSNIGDRSGLPSNQVDQNGPHGPHGSGGDVATLAP